MLSFFFFFFFQAEDGIRDLYVTGVQTCALPIFDLRYRNGLCGAGQAGRSAPDYQRAGRDVRREPERGALDSQNLCGFEREGDGVFMAGTWLSGGSDRSLL